MIDTHSHIDAEEFNDDREDVILRAKAAGVEKIFLPNINPQSLPQIEQLCSRHPGYLYPMIGLHPEDANPEQTDIGAFMQEMEERLQQANPFVAIGEVGLDYYWDTTYRDLQLEAFERQVEWAAKYDLPLMIHSRSSHEDIVRIIGRHYDKGLSGVFHCFAGSKEEAQQLLQFPDFMLGIGGVLTFKKSDLPEVLSTTVPLSRIVLETDAPYLAPVPKRGKRNEPSFVAYTLARLAQVYDVTPEEVEDITNANVTKIFKKL